MEIIEKNFDEENDGFEGYMLAYTINPSKENNLSNFLRDEGIPEAFINQIERINDEILVIKNIYVDEEYRGNGYGNEILEELLSHSLSGKVILIADMDETQQEGFNLIAFYNSYGFISPLKQNNALMVSEELKIELTPKTIKKPKF